MPYLSRRTTALLLVVLPLLALFIYVVLRSGPLAPVAVTVTSVQNQSIVPSLFGIGRVEARYSYRLGPTAAGRLQRLDVQVGDRVRAGQLLGEMDPVDLDARVHAQEAAWKRAQATVREATARQSFAKAQWQRYQQLLISQMTTEEWVATKAQELQSADAALASAQQELARVAADRAAAVAQRQNLRLVSPVDGVVVTRALEPGSTVVAGQAVVEVIDPASLWVHVRFDQHSATGLAAGQAAEIVLRSRSGQPLPGQVHRLEPMADAVTEELLAKVTFSQPLERLPPLGELAEVTVRLPALPAMPTVPNAAIRSLDGQRGVWTLSGGELSFVPVVLGASDLNGQVQLRKGVTPGTQVVVYSAKALTAKSRARVVEQIPGTAK